MTLDTAILVFLLIPIAGVAAILLALCARWLAEERRAKREGRPVPPGVKFLTGWMGSLGILETIAALCLTAWLASRQEGLWKVVPLVLVNLVLQPVCLLAIAGCLHQLGHGLHGRLTYAFDVIPQGEMAADRYRELVHCRVGESLFLILVFGGMSCACIWPLL
jgi:hypothetical protein